MTAWSNTTTPISSHPMWFGIGTTTRMTRCTVLPIVSTVGTVLLTGTGRAPPTACSGNTQAKETAVSSSCVGAVSMATTRRWKPCVWWWNRSVETFKRRSTDVVKIETFKFSLQLELTVIKTASYFKSFYQQKKNSFFFRIISYFYFNLFFFIYNWLSFDKICCMLKLFN